MDLPDLPSPTSRKAAFQALDDIAAACPPAHESFNGDTGRFGGNRSTIARYYAGHLPFLLQTLQSPELELTADEQTKFLSPFVRHVGFDALLDAFAPVLSNSASSNHDIRPLLTGVLVDKFDTMIDYHQFDDAWNAVNDASHKAPMLNKAFGRQIAAIANARCSEEYLRLAGLAAIMDMAASIGRTRLRQGVVAGAMDRLSQRIVDEMRAPDYDWYLIEEMQSIRHGMRAGLSAARLRRPEVQRQRREYLCDKRFALNRM